MSASDTQCTDITIVNDAILERTEIFTVQLTTEDISFLTMSEDISFTPRYATVTIFDDDGEYGGRV